MANEQTMLAEIDQLIRIVKRGRPEDRSEKARRYAITITELEKARAYFKTYVTDVSGEA